MSGDFVLRVKKFYAGLRSLALCSIVFLAAADLLPDALCRRSTEIAEFFGANVNP